MANIPEFITIFGRAGTGKSYALSSEIKASYLREDDFIVLAPTHCSLNNIYNICKESMDIDFKNFKTMCAYFRIDYTRDVILGPITPYSVIFIDEFSLIDKNIFERCLLYIKSSIIYLCGDPLQLAAISKNNSINFKDIRRFSKNGLVNVDVLEHMHLSVFSLECVQKGKLIHLKEYRRFDDSILKLINAIYKKNLLYEYPFISFSDTVERLRSGEYTMIASKYSTLQRFYDMIAGSRRTFLNSSKSSFSE
jgi:hypothetical protein